ncbi:hypothetical protein FC18_GL000054 [Lacticaseibacillus sharpeae JCM 1186 = DSM 20505]|uniref:Uncharacterized protein n=2 Tax=Lacticaseibacillus sharpeae TaxID=1626 RepID=A0A0R1ZZ20_9LACO|nr:hypothetical protein FC18_GL000054 [Lacticaseibacillus sharpeae JCM 1186 = DSM 20505]
MFKKHYSKSLYKEAIRALASDDRPVLNQLSDHALHGNWQGFRELHVDKKDWLLAYTIDNGKLILTLTATGTHDDLFGH